MPLIEVNPTPSAVAAQPPRSDADEATPASQGTARTDETRARALVRRVVTDVRQHPRDESQRLSQALLGEAVIVLEETAAWARVRLERDSCTGWMHARALHRCGPGETEAYLQACNALVSTELLPAFLHLAPLRPGGLAGGGKVGMGEAGKLPFGVELPVVDQQELWAAVRLPDNTQWWVSNVLMPLSSRPGPDTPGIAFAVDLIKRCVGVPFLSGGRTTFGFDDAGLAQTLWGFLGVNIPRHAPEQYAAGRPVETEPQPGDAIFFGEPQSDGQRTNMHVAISLGGDDVIHANRHTWSVAIHSLNSASHLYHAWLCDNLVGVRRFG